MKCPNSECNFDFISDMKDIVEIAQCPYCGTLVYPKTKKKPEKAKKKIAD